MKRFFEWIKLKQKLDGKQKRAPYVSESDVWWASVGENVGAEIDGKSQYFSRPVIIVKKLSRGFYFVVPTTTQKRTGSWYVSYWHQGLEITACLHQVRAIDFRRLHSKLGELDSHDFERIKYAMKKLYFP